ncbi:MAG: LacI family transcriptional regulator [Treponema sp.]|jgi:LacI family transcriptional regulator|nr:LacI family transcriptional regulator [Treponema sp.]
MSKQNFIKRPLRQPATLKDIARITGYSVNTVSRALRDKKDISAETKEKIKKISLDMGYINNAQASSLRLGHTNTIAVILGDISNPYFGIQMKEIENRAREQGYSSFLINTNENTEMEREAIQSALNKNVDGILICPSQHNEDTIRYLMETGMPFVQIGRYFENLEAGYVLQNDELGGYQAVKHLIDNGHQDILMLNGPLYVSASRGRLAGYKRALTEAGLPVKPELIREVPIIGDGCSAVISAVLREKLQFSAIFAFSDLIALDVWACLKNQGRHVPEDYSLIGFDNIQSRLAMPFRLSTVSANEIKMAAIAIDFLIGIMKGNRGDTFHHLIVDTELIPGETVRPLHKK